MESAGTSPGQLIPLFLTWAIPILIVAAALYFRRRATDELALRKTIGDALLALSMMGVLVATLAAARPNLETHVTLVPLRDLWHTLTEAGDAGEAGRDVILNVCLFVPLGFFAALRFHRKHRIARATLAGIALACVVEVCQLLFLTGRTVDVNDIILNSVGAFIGALLARMIKGPAGP